MRLDVALTKKGFVESREKAKYLIKKGCVVVDGIIVKKPSKKVNENSKIVLIEGFEFVGKGGYKLDAAVKNFKIDFKDKIVADVGCSIGGFTDYALKNGAKKVYAIDKGDVLHQKLRKNEKVIYLPKTDARNIEALEEKIDICLVDVTFSSIKPILLTVKNWLKHNGKVIGLIKPPFETPKPKKISNYKKCLEIAKEIGEWASKNGYCVGGIINIEPQKTRQHEFFICLTLV